MKKPLIFLLKLLLMAALLGYVGWKLYQTWDEATHDPIQINWLFGLLSILLFAGTMLTSSLTWLWLTRKMGHRGPVLPLLAAYWFSQMGKYIPGKVMLLLMRIERTKRLGMDTQICVVSTLVENAMYLVSGGLVAVATLAIFLQHRPALLFAILALTALLLLAFHPKIFYYAVNKTLSKMKRPEVPPEKRLGKTELLTAVAMFLPVWFFGGLSLWCATRAVTPGIALHEFTRLPGAYSLGVTGGMISLLPGGLGPNEGVKTLFLQPLVGAKIAALAAVLQRLAQIIIELTLGVTGALLTTLRKPKNTPNQTTPAPKPDSPS